MAQITSSVGLISGIDTGSIINQLISLDSAPVTLLQTQSDAANSQSAAYQDLASVLSQIQTIGNSLALPQTFQNTTATSSDPNVLSATTSVGSAVGSYQLQVSRLVTTQQSISQGFANATTAPVGAGNITLQLGGGEASSQTTLASLDGGAGAQRGQFRITDQAGNTAVIDTTNDITLDDVVKQINSSLNISVKASLTDNGLVLSDTSGSTSNALAVQDLGGGTAAKSLGITGPSTGGVITGTPINYLGTGTALNQLNDGRGINTTTVGQTDFTVNLSDGSQVNVSVASANTVGDVITAINKAGGTKLTADFAPGGSGLRLTDNTGGGGALTITEQNGSSAAADLGLTAPATGNTITGTPVLAGLDSVLVSSLNGGHGLPLGTINVTDRQGHTGPINLAGATSVSDIINDINNNTHGIQVTASLNNAGTGIQLIDNSGGTGNLVIADAGSTTAAAPGIAGTFDNTTAVVNGANLQRQYVSQNSLLTDYNGGQGVNLGQFQITNSLGATATVDLSQGSFNTLGDVIKAINAKGIGVTASINTTGNGLLLTDTAGGANKLKVTDLGSTTAADLNIAGTATATTIDGAEEKTIAVTATDTLSSLATKINQAGFGVNASVIDDGSGLNSARLSLTALNTGSDGHVVIDSGTTNLGVQNLVNGQNAAVFVGGGNGAAAQPLLVTSSKNQLTNLIKGVTVSLVGASTNPVTLNITNDPSAVSTSLQSFVTNFNSLVTKINTDTEFNTTTNQGGVLLGDATANQIQSTIYGIATSVVSGAGQYKTLADVGITITDGAQLNFDADKFAAAYANSPSSVQNLFSQATTGIGNVIGKAVSTLTDPVNGVITLETNTLGTQVKQFQDSITNLNTLLAQKRSQLEEQFANMESVLANLQSQGALFEFPELIEFHIVVHQVLVIVFVVLGLVLLQQRRRLIGKFCAAHEIAVVALNLLHRYSRYVLRADSGIRVYESAGRTKLSSH